MPLSVALTGSAVTAPVVTQLKVSLPAPPLILSKAPNVPVGALYVSLPVVPVKRELSTLVVSGQIL